MSIKDQGCLLRKKNTGEYNCLLVLFLKQHGLKMVLSRRSTTSSSSFTDPDLFETGEVNLDFRGENKPAYLREFIPSVGYHGIARKYKALELASRLTRFYEKNLVHMEFYDSAWELLQTSLNSFSLRSQPETVYLKSLFVFAKMEGYPVKENWLRKMPAGKRQDINRLIQSPVDSIDVNTLKVEEWIRNLEKYFLQHTELLIADNG